MKVRISFDAILVHHTGAVVTPKAFFSAAMSSFTSYTIGHNIGATVFTGGVVRLRILSNFADLRLARAMVRLSPETLKTEEYDGERIARLEERMKVLEGEVTAAKRMIWGARAWP